MSMETVLSGEPGRRVVRIGDRVYRRTGWWTPAVHALLRHLEACGFRYSPRVIGIDGQGREILSYIAGSSGAQGWVRVVGDGGLARFARLLRAYHDAVRTFEPPAGVEWAWTDGAVSEGEIVCHGDFGPWNVVWRGDHPVGILDWDFVGPGPAIDDVAYALEYSIPFRDDQTAVRWLDYERPPDRRRRIQVFAEAYGLETTAGLVDQVARRQRLTIARVRVLGARGLQPQATWLTGGFLGELEARVGWTEHHRAVFE
jgi:hypothetical protein